jgi:hypothetical protein
MAAYPRKQTFMIFAICALVVGGVAFYVRGQSLGQNSALSMSKEAASVTADNSPLPETDWKNQFLDSATSSAFKTPAETSKTTKSEDLTATDKLGSGFFTKFAELSKAGLSNDPKIASNVMGQLASSVVADMPNPETYSLADIRSTGYDKGALIAYEKALTNIFAKYLPKDNEALIADQATADGDMSKLSQIDPVIAGYKAIVTNLLKLPAPKPLAQQHLDLVNGFSIALYNAESLRHLDTDPVRGLAAISLEIGGLQNISAAASSIKTYLTSAGIPLSI